MALLVLVTHLAIVGSAAAGPIDPVGPLYPPVEFPKPQGDFP